MIRIRILITLPQISMEAHRGPYIEDRSLISAPSPLPCSFGGDYDFEAYKIKQITPAPGSGFFLKEGSGSSLKGT